MKQIVSSISGKFFFNGTQEECMAYLKSYGLESGTGSTQFQILPIDSKRKRGEFSELMQIQLGTYKPEQNFVDEVLEEKTGYTLSPEAHNQVKGIILGFMKDADGGLKRSQIITGLAQRGHDVPERKVRLIIEELINEDGFAIQSSETGWQLIRSTEQLNDSIKYLRSKAFPLFERASNLKKNFYRDKSIQLSFEEFFRD